MYVFNKYALAFAQINIGIHVCWVATVSRIYKIIGLFCKRAL